MKVKDVSFMALPTFPCIQIMCASGKVDGKFRFLSY